MNQELFDKTCKQVISLATNKDGIIGDSSQIGTLREKTVHAVVKSYIEPDFSNHEIKIDNYYADIVNEDGIIEVQNGNFNKLRNKLNALLDLKPLTIVYPVCHIKMIHWIEEDTGEVGKPRKSPVKGTPHMIFRELYKIKNYLNHPNLKFHIILMDMDEYRLLDGWSKDKKSGATKCDRIPTKLIDELSINSVEDYYKFIPDNLPTNFTVKDYRKAAKIKLKDAQAAVNILNHLDTIKRIGNKGRAYLYTY